MRGEYSNRDEPQWDPGEPEEIPYDDSEEEGESDGDNE